MRTVADRCRVGWPDRIFASYSLRHLVFALRPPSLDSEGLDVAFRNSLQEWAPEENVSVTVTSNSATELNTEERTVVFRIGQEALSNARKHARARSISVSLEECDGGRMLDIVEGGGGGVVCM